MRKLWGDNAWDEYIYWQTYDKKIAGKINDLLKSVEREGAMKGIGKPEPLKRRKGYSRRITDEHRLVYDIEDGVLFVYACRGHYE